MAQTYFQVPPQCLVEENLTLQGTAVAGLWKLWRYPQLYKNYVYALFVTRSIIVHTCLNEEP